MKMLGVVGFAVLGAGSLFAGIYGDLPDAKHAWAVHDLNRPNPKKISAEAGAVPSDAKVLFDGSAASVAANWCDGKGGPTKWKVDEKGDLISVSGAGYIFTKGKFSDFQLHVEWAAPLPVQGKGQGRGNSGVFLMGNYEIQVLDSYETDPDAPGGNRNPNYADGQAGAVYGQNPPMVNPARAPGVFNSYDIVFHAPIEEGGVILRPATVTVLFNGVVVQDHWLFDGPTGHRDRATYARTTSDSGLVRTAKMPIAFQDHGNPVHYRNVWIREIPRPEDNVTHGDYYARAAAVAECRRKTAAALYAKLEKPLAPTADNMLAMAEVISYAKEGEIAATWKKLAEEFHGVLDGMSDAELTAQKGKLLRLRDALDMLIRNGAVRQSCGTRIRINAASLRLKWEKL